MQSKVTANCDNPSGYKTWGFGWVHSLKPTKTHINLSKKLHKAAYEILAPPREFIRTIFSEKIWMETMKKGHKILGQNAQKFVHKPNKQHTEL